jgi:2-methylcitrate dehydratase PrpD
MTVTEHPTSSLSRQFADAVASMTLDDIPTTVLAVAKSHVLDALGIAIASTGMDYGHAIHRAGEALGGTGNSRAIGFGAPMPAASAALVNGTLMHGLDFDDTHIGAIYHATSPALAAALAVGTAEHADGASVLLAHVAGLEVGCRLAAAGSGLFHGRGFHPTGIAGAFAAACVAAKVQDLPAETLTSALGLCGSQAAGILELHGSWLKRMHPGWAAHSGIAAVTMADAGFRGPKAVFEGPGGLFRSHLDVIPTAETLGLEDLGSRWMTADIALKPYPCCHFTHAFVDAARDVLSQVGRDHLSPDDVDRIVCPTPELIMAMVTQPVAAKIAPRTIYDALFSVQYVVAAALLGRSVDLDLFYDQPLDDPDVLAMAAKVTCVVDPDSDFPTHFTGEVQIELTDGTHVGRRVPASHGTPDDPMTNDEIQAKFQAVSGRRIDVDQSNRIAELVDRIEDLADINELVDALTVAGATATNTVQASD